MSIHRNEGQPMRLEDCKVGALIARASEHSDAGSLYRITRVMPASIDVCYINPRTGVVRHGDRVLARNLGAWRPARPQEILMLGTPSVLVARATMESAKHSADLARKKIESLREDLVRAEEALSRLVIGEANAADAYATALEEARSAMEVTS